jgi:protein-S-isoprenylcysteine O-methyltransferase Ste14
VLSLAVVQVLTAAALVAACAAIGIGLLRRPRAKEPVRVKATNAPARGTELVWVLGTVVAVLWGLGVFIAPSYAYHWPAFPDFPGSVDVQILGIALTGMGGFLYAGAAQSLGRHMTPEIRVQEGHQLVQSGPYRHIRHPVYTAILLVATGGTLFFLSLPLGLLALLLLGLANYRARLEEALLSSPEGFGTTYREYMARTGRFLPRLRSVP